MPEWTTLHDKNAYANVLVQKGGERSRSRRRTEMANGDAQGRSRRSLLCVYAVFVPRAPSKRKERSWDANTCAQLINRITCTMYTSLYLDERRFSFGEFRPLLSEFQVDLFVLCQTGAPRKKEAAGTPNLAFTALLMKSMRTHGIRACLYLFILTFI